MQAFDGAASTIAVTTAGTSAASLLPGRPGPGMQVRLANIGTTAVFVAFGPDTTVTATVPSGTANTTSTCVLGNTERVFALPVNCYAIAYIFNTAGAATTLVISVGSGNL